jgi:hypothetical protein
MLPAEEIAKITNELENLRSALRTCTDHRIREVIEIRMEERSLRLRQLRPVLEPLRHRPLPRPHPTKTGH